ncbi:hypothetical protein G7Y89_g12532 [Cudoniella acicularis]|uniref:Rhodopsin domain-containing protein n=1 Tax=Cudoniella acicularis TaxID=354080 RepID=A0A8H4VWV7_9HELO|nr:hypothetical protein G7Y89_g12532 [Cudoniella acicularis]
MNDSLTIVNPRDVNDPAVPAGHEPTCAINSVSDMEIEAKARAVTETVAFLGGAGTPLNPLARHTLRGLGLLGLACLEVGRVAAHPSPQYILASYTVLPDFNVHDCFLNKQIPFNLYISSMSSEQTPRANGFVAVLFIFTFLAVFFVGLRLIARLVFLKNGGRDEVAIVASLICSIGLTVASMQEVKYGVGKHVEDIPLQDVESQLEALYFAIILYNVSLTLTKFSIVLQYLRVFVKPRIRMACKVVMGIILVYGLQTLLCSILACIPVSGFWLINEPSKCIDKKFQWFFNASFNILTDLLILSLPIPVLLNIQLPTKQKLLLTFVFALGGFVCLISILRLRSLYVLSVSTDPTFDNLDAGMWSAIEVNMGIICASLQTIRPIIARMFPRLLGTSRAQTKNSSELNTFQSKRLTKGLNKPLPALEQSNISAVSQTVTRISKGERLDTRHYHDVEKGRMVIDVDKEILVTTSTTVEGGHVSETSSEHDLIFQKH